VSGVSCRLAEEGKRTPDYTGRNGNDDYPWKGGSYPDGCAVVNMGGNMDRTLVYATVDGRKFGPLKTADVARLTGRKGVEIHRTILTEEALGKQKAESRKQKAESRKQKAESRKLQEPLPFPDWTPVSKRGVNR
jgi:hypothetical protein